MEPLKNSASVLRSKNAGAFVLTIDVVFKTKKDYAWIVESGALLPEEIAKLYRLAPTDVLIIPYPEVLSVKVTMPRRIGSGDLSDTDVYGAQQHVPLMLMQVPARAA
ncbi:DUF4387 domain-containing protein [Candidimonas sp. SYP-B2681]|uniref:DUF4387 domain-containing protein n=1 Tax=Candidimonas sp. SYP-B2681 TaxID=2497686 RepID=UPI000F8877F9|nr:DUF4387 domain-containing protein [Candidimonas sp. SYP-B2681]RTZ44400.1 DUF4387 domain-containing protein [Candidimonas sp. SYP-B2681]